MASIYLSENRYSFVVSSYSKSGKKEFDKDTLEPHFHWNIQLQFDNTIWLQIPTKPLSLFHPAYLANRAVENSFSEFRRK